MTMTSCRRMDAFLVSLVALVFIIGSEAQNVPMIRPIAYRLPAPPSLIGPLSPNDVLMNAEKVHNNLVKGVSSFVNYDGHLYASTGNKIFDIARCPPRLVANLSPQGCYSTYTCGQVMSLRQDPDSGYLLALDTFRGLLAVHPLTGAYQLIYSTNTPVNGRQPVHLNDMVVTKDGVIIMSDSSDMYNVDYDTYICMDGRPTGRLLAFYPKTGSISELLPNTFNFPNGLELTPDGDLLVGETCRATIHRVSLKRSSYLQVNPFSVNLPGLPDNIRSSGRGTYWVAMSYARHASVTNPVDDHSGNPMYRGMGFRRMSLNRLRDMFTKWGIVVELDGTGNIIGSLHDQSGTTLSMINEVNEFGGVLHFASHIANFTARVLLPPESGVKVSIDSFIQVKRSRCELPDAKVESVRKQFLEQQNSSTTTPQPTLP